MVTVTGGDIQKRAPGGEIDKVKIDSGMLQFAPKGSYYEGKNEQFQAVNKMWTYLFKFDRPLFCLVSLLAGTGFSKGAMAHVLLSNPMATDPRGREVIPEGLDGRFEEQVINYNLYKESTPRALKNLLLLVGDKQHDLKRVNNARTKRIIINFIFDRESEDLQYLAINYKGKLAKLIKHALGKQNLTKVLNGNVEILNKLCGGTIDSRLPVGFNINERSYQYQVFLHIFNKPLWATGYYLPLLEAYSSLRKAAKINNVKSFLRYAKDLPYRTVMGFRNTYKVDVEISDIMDKSTMSGREKLQMEASAKRHGTEIKHVNYKTQDLYDLWKAFYYKLENKDPENMDKIAEAIEFRADKLDKLDFGKCVVIIDASHSMIGSDERRLHPFLTALSMVFVIDNMIDVIYVGGEARSTGVKNHPTVMFPSGGTPLWRGLCEAVILKPQTIILISDGYENAISGMFSHVYDHFKNTGYKFELLHINPVFAADSKSGTVRKVATDVSPLPVNNYKYLETEVIFNKMIDNRQIVKNLLVGKFKKLIRGGD